jgi:hypothetical protein
MGGNPSRMAEKDRFIKKKMKKWVYTNGRDPNPIEREELVEQFTEEFFGKDSAEQLGPIDKRERNIKLRF